MARLPLHEFMADVQSRIASLRSELQAVAPTILESIQDLQSVERAQLTGEAYVRSVGTMVKFQRGTAEYLYEPEALPVRDRGLAAVSSGRDALFAAMAAQCPADCRVLNIGAGGDTALVQQFVRAGHEVISTDFAENTVQALARRITSPTFACDLVDLGRVLPEPVDVIVGNSVMGYLDPSKVDRVVRVVHDVMTRGAVFTFDLTPHPSYFELLDEKERGTCVNASGANPAKLLELLRRYGAKHGLGAMAYHVACRSLSAKLALVSLLRTRFAGLGARCATGAVALKRLASLTLRVSRSFDPILEPVAGETPYDDADAYLTGFIQRAPPPRFDLRYIDRGAGEALARQLGIHRSTREDPWLVADHVAASQDAAGLPAEVRDEVVAEILPSKYAARIDPYLAGKPMPETRPLPTTIAFDQMCHCMVLDKAVSIDVREADRRIDLMYAGAPAAPARKESGSEEDRRRERNQRKRERKGGRGR
jgi:hypothetical protein